MRTGITAFAVVAVWGLGAGGKIKLSQIYGVPRSVRDGTTPVLLQRDAQNSYFAGEVIDEGPMDLLWGLHCLPHRRGAAGRAQGTYAADTARQ